MTGHVFVVNGDLTQLKAHAVAYSTSTHLWPDGDLFPAFARRFPAFVPAFQRLARPCRVGDAFWIALDGEHPCGIVVAAAAGGGRAVDRETKARDAVTHALDTAVGELRKRYPAPEQLLIALPTFRLGMGGDRHMRLASARVQIRAAHEALARHPHVDTAFVSYTADGYRIFLQARRELALGPVCPPGVPPPDTLIEALRARRCVLFVGAGLSAGAGLPSWKALIDRLSADLGLPAASGHDVEHHLDLAQWYVEKRGRDALAPIIAGLFGGGVGRPTLAHYLLTALPVQVIVTTNYDDLLERSLKALRLHPVPIVDQKDVVRTGRSEGVCVVKFHGDAVTGKGIVLGRDDYDGFFRQRPAMALLLEGLLLNQTFLFAGYGLKDPNFRQIYSRIADMLAGAAREAFALTVDEGNETSALQSEQWRRKGLHLLPAPGSTVLERIRASVIFLDWLADQVSLRSHDLFLAHDVPLDGPLKALQAALMHSAGQLVEESMDAPLAESEAHRVAEVLAFLTEQGYRPRAGSGFTLATMWERLAGAFADPAQKRRMLVRALRHAERDDRVQRIQDLLDSLGGA